MAIPTNVLYVRLRPGLIRDLRRRSKVEDRSLAKTAGIVIEAGLAALAEREKAAV